MGVSVSVVIPAYNAEVFISEAIESVLAQTYPIQDIIVVDDGSLDKTVEMAANFPQVGVVRQPNRGPGAARNAGVRYTSGEWIAFLDADDTWSPQKIETQVSYIRSQSVGVVHGDRYEHVTFETMWRREAHVSPSGALVRKQAFQEVGGFDEARGLIGVEDLNLWMRMALAGWRFLPSETGLFNWRLSGNNLSGNEVNMLKAELVNADKISKLAQIPEKQAEQLKRTIRLEYARNLIGGGNIQTPT